MAKTTKKSKPTIRSALEMQRELEELFLIAKEKGDIRQAAYVSQVWTSLEVHAQKERENSKEEKTAIDDLVLLLGKMREELVTEEDQ